MQLIAGRVGQQYNRRKSRKGAYWEDRYHATAVQADSHLAQCMVYIDLNMVRAGVVDHPRQWRWGGFNEIQNPRTRYVVVDYNRLITLTGFTNLSDFQASHRGWIAEKLGAGPLEREDRWTKGAGHSLNA